MEDIRVPIVDLYSRHVYGYSPADTVTMLVQDVTSHDVLEGRASRIQKVLTLRRGGRSVDLDLLIYVPNGEAHEIRTGPNSERSNVTPYPAFLGLNFGGNQTVESDPLIRMTSSYTISKPGVKHNLATDATRGAASGRWPVSLIISRGYALVTLHCGNVRPDNRNQEDAGVQALFPDFMIDDATRWGAIAVWAWGLSRVLDCLIKMPLIDASRVMIVGHSRLGKASLWAGVCDPRFFGVVSNCSGCGGSAIYRRCVGERIRDITERFPHWFNRYHNRYRDAENELPVDQHMLLSAIAPRMLHISSASRDAWADPDGELLSALLATETYENHGVAGLPLSSFFHSESTDSADVATAARPARVYEPILPIGGTLQYHRREGVHDITAEDWKAVLDHADLAIKAKKNSNRRPTVG